VIYCGETTLSTALTRELDSRDPRTSTCGLSLSTTRIPTRNVWPHWARIDRPRYLAACSASCPKWSREDGCKGCHAETCAYTEYKGGPRKNLPLNDRTLRQLSAFSLALLRHAHAPTCLSASLSTPNIALPPAGLDSRTPLPPSHLRSALDFARSR
jgi:hypothetical protein